MHMKVWAFMAGSLLAAMPAGGAGAPSSATAQVASQKLQPVPNATHNLRLYAHTFRGTRWNNDEILSAVVEAAALLAQCDIAVTRVELRIIEAPQRFRVFYTPDSRELLRNFATPKPALFFVEDTKNNPAFDAEAIGAANSKTRPELENTIWVAYGARDLSRALAHELVHVLSDSGEHSDEPGNLMHADTAASNEKLTAAQCDLLRLRGEKSGLLRRRSP